MSRSQFSSLGLNFFQVAVLVSKFRSQLHLCLLVEFSKPLPRACLSVSSAEMSGLWNFSFRVQSWSAKVESDPVLIRKFFKIISPIQSWSAHIKPCILFCLMSRASFCNFCNFFLQLPTASWILKIYVAQCFELFPRILYCNFLQLFRFLRATFYCNFYQVLRKM